MSYVCCMQGRLKVFPKPPSGYPWRSLLTCYSTDELHLFTFSKKIPYSCFLTLTVDFAILGERLVPLVG